MTTEASSVYLWQGGQWVDNAHWPLNDRALHYGDGLFETLRLAPDGSLPLWSLHRKRLLKGLLALDFPVDALAQVEAAVAQAPRAGTAAKLLVSRGAGPRGYLPPAEPQLQLQWQAFAAPAWACERFSDGFDCEFSDVRLAPQPLLAGCKHLNRLEQVLIRKRMPSHTQESVVLDSDEWVIEGCMSNLFLLEGSQWVTPDLSRCGVDGVIRQWLLRQRQVRTERVDVNRLLAADAVLMTNTLNGVQRVRSIGAKRYDSHKDILTLQQQLQELFA